MTYRQPLIATAIIACVVITACSDMTAPKNDTACPIINGSQVLSDFDPKSRAGGRDARSGTVLGCPGGTRRGRLVADGTRLESAQRETVRGFESHPRRQPDRADPVASGTPVEGRQRQRRVPHVVQPNPAEVR